MRKTIAARRSERGQILVIVAGGMIVIVAMVGLIIDGGHAWARQRGTQNGADSVAKAGTVVIQHHLAEIDTPTDGDVGCAAEAAAAANDITLEMAEYTDFGGQLFNPTIIVGPCAAGAGGPIPPDAQGVRATAMTDFDTFIMAVVGVPTLTARADATAVVGVPAGMPGGALPTTFPQVGSTCNNPTTAFEIREDDEDGTWEPYEIIDEADADAANLAIVPLCDVAPGSVGWLNYECGQNLEESIEDPCEKYIPIPAWLDAQTGNPNCCEDELNENAGPNVGSAEPEDSVVALPVHDNTCDGRPADDDPTCMDIAPEWSGQGTKMSYHVPFWIGFKLDQAYMQGGDKECQEGPGSPILTSPQPPGKVGCLKGWFVEKYGAPGPIGLKEINPGDDVMMAIGLID